jgi:hypothetical protein
MTAPGRRTIATGSGKAPDTARRQEIETVVRKPLRALTARARATTSRGNP